MIDVINFITESRPKANHQIEQFLMTSESLWLQLQKTASTFEGKRILFLGDDDHFSIVLSHFIRSTQITVLEIDERIIENQQLLEKELNLSNHSILKYDAAYPINKDILPFEAYDAFVVNPPYGSKNELYGGKVWVSRCLDILKTGGLGLIVLPVDFKYRWSVKNMQYLQQFLTENGCVVFQLDRNLHDYFDVNDKGLQSSNIWIVKLEQSEKLIGLANQNLYR